MKDLKLTRGKVLAGFQLETCSEGRHRSGMASRERVGAFCTLRGVYGSAALPGNAEAAGGELSARGQRDGHLGDRISRGTCSS